MNDRKKNVFQKSSSYQEKNQKYLSRDSVSTGIRNCSNALGDLSSSKENIELSLEVEIADSLKRLLSKPQNCNSRLLDVTIIRPSKECDNLNRVETNTVAFGKDDIKDLLTIIERQDTDKEDTRVKKRKSRPVSSANVKPKYEFKTSKRHDEQPGAKRHICAQSAPPNMNIFKNKYGQSNLRNVEARLIEICNNQVSSIYAGPEQDTSNSSNETHNYRRKRDTTIGDGSKAHHVYAAAQTFDGLRKTLACQKKHHRTDEKPDTPCLCQHCGMIGLLIESQKGPVLTNANAPVWSTGPRKNEPKHTSPTNSKQGRYVDLRTKHKSNETDDVNSRLKHLEERVTNQEEHYVHKDYFKKIIGKLISFCQNKTNSPPQLNHGMDVKDHSVQCSFDHRYGKRDVKLSANTTHRHSHRCEDQCYCVNSLTIQQTTAETTKKSFTNYSIKETPSRTLDQLWKWGEEPIKPGFDLKTKIMSLLDEKLSHQPTTQDDELANKLQETFVKDIKYKNGEKRNQNKKTVNDRCRCSLMERVNKNEKHQQGRCIKCELTRDSIRLESCSSTISNVLNISSSNPHVVENKYKKRQRLKTSTPDTPINLTKSQYDPIFMKHHDKIEKQTGIFNKTPLHVAYVSPNVKNWNNDSTTSVLKVKDNAAQINSSNKNKLQVDDAIQG